VSRTFRDRLADISDAADGVRKAVQALERAEAKNAEDAAQLAFDALLYRLVVIGERSRRCPPISWRRSRKFRSGKSPTCAICSITTTIEWMRRTSGAR